ncbi:hypothetical protein [Alterisphingorhabdus coralli]|uniref:Uncharacterized protein n=1 Tax=Alterisphingorhabdus coralli TaxID=3071408 RepID=A0AA97F7L5_9SPHN|nr:hypothetical protein [Parasphingorhabdus sp. SCSIO 66989]WOE75656.1 hypothetical protein RB602_02775 [Parasphingorhabdus sp. SCSIO 66989]
MDSQLVFGSAAALLLLSACSDNDNQQQQYPQNAQYAPNQGYGPARVGPQNNQGQRYAVVPRQPYAPVEPPPPNYGPAIEDVLMQDDRIGQTGAIDRNRVNRMRAISLNNTPSDFRVAFLDHIFAWERRVKAEEALKALDNKDPSSVIIGGIICEALDCSKNPLDSHSEAYERVDREIAIARDEVSSTWRNVQRVAVSHGADLNRAIPSQ